MRYITKAFSSVGVYSLFLLLGFGMALPAAAQVPIPVQINPSVIVDEASIRLRQLNTIFCEVEATNKNVGLNKNEVTIRLHYTVGGVIRNVPYSLQLASETDLLAADEGEVTLDQEDGYITLDENMVTHTFNPALYSYIDAQAKVGGRNCKSARVHAIPSNRPIDAISTVDLTSPDRFEFDPDLADRLNGDVIVDAGDDGGNEPDQDVPAVQEEEVAPRCRIVAEAKKDDNRFSVYFTLAYSGFTQGDHDYRMQVYRSGAENPVAELDGMVAADQTGSGYVLSNDGGAYVLRLDRDTEEATFTIGGSMRTYDCEQAVFLDTGTQNDASDDSEESDRVLPSDLAQEDEQLLDVIKLDEDATEVSVATNTTEDDAGAFGKKEWILLIILAGVLGAGITYSVSKRN